MNPEPIIFVFLMGVSAAVLSLSPAALRKFLEGIETLREEFDSTAPWNRRRDAAPDLRPAQSFFQFAGAVLIVLSAIALAQLF